MDKQSGSENGAGVSFFEKIKKGFLEPPPKDEIQNKEEVRAKYAKWRLVVFVSMYISYIVFYLCRKNISVALAPIGDEFGMSKLQLGLLGGTLYITYAIGKFVNGVISDRANVRIFTPLALIFSAISNIGLVLCATLIAPVHRTIFGLPSDTIILWGMAFFWGLNGWFQSAGFPPAAKTLTFWFSNKERATKWSLWSTSHEVGSWLAILFSGFLLSSYGWRAIFYGPAILGIITSIFLFKVLRDKPSTMGLPDIEDYHGTSKPKNNNSNSSVNVKENDSDTYLEIFKQHILLNKTVWLLALAYIFVYIVRFGTFDWMYMYLMEAKHYDKKQAAYILSFLPLFGILGTLSAGIVSDKFFKGRRAPVNIVYLLGVVLSIIGFKFINGSILFDIANLGLLGIFTCGPQVLIGGVCAVESSSKRVASAVTGFTGSFGYVGAILSSIMTGWLLDDYGWNGAMFFWIMSAVICIALCVPLWNAKPKNK